MAENSWDDSDIVKTSDSESKILAPDSESEETDETKIRHLSRNSSEIVLSSDEDSSDNNTTKEINKFSLKDSSLNNLSKSSVSKSLSKQSKTKTIKSDEDSSESPTSMGKVSNIIHHKNNLDIEEENNISKNESIKFQSKKKKNFVIESDEDSEESINQSPVGINNKSHKKSTEADEISPFRDNLFSSTRFLDDNKNSRFSINTSEISNANVKDRSPHNISVNFRSSTNTSKISSSNLKDKSLPNSSVNSLSAINISKIQNSKETSSPNISNNSDSSINISKISKATTKNKTSLNSDTGKNIPIIDLTRLENRTSNKSNYREVIEEQSDDDSNNEKIEIIDSESEDEKFDKKKSVVNEVDFNNQLNSLTISGGSNKESKVESQKNDYLTRKESLTAEETRLKMQVSEVMKNIDTIKTTMRTANLAALPDKGIRLQMSLKKEETKLRDLRYQQSSVSNEILKLQISSKTHQPLLKQEPVQKMYKLPTTNTDINAMGKKALETHRTQQALTVDALRSLHSSLKNCPSEDTCVPDPKGLQVKLMPHQTHALAWLLWREKEKPSGGILADDMGLGKTLTMISLILKASEQNDEENDDNESDEDSDSENKWLSSQRDKLVPGKTLVVCPASLVGQWENEINNKLKRGMLDVMIHHGPNREKKPKRLARPDVVITTYQIIPREATSMSSLFGVRWERIILDEGHQIRNHKTQTAQAVFKLKAKHRWVLTGTPVQNKEIDLYALLKFLRCSPFDDLAVWKRWVDNRDAAGLQRLNTIIKSIMLRRTKQSLQEQGQLSSLKDKSFHTILTKLDKEEESAYEKLVKFSSTLFAQFLHQKAEQKNALPGMSVSSKSSNYLKNLENPFENHPDLARLHKQMKEVSDIKSHHILVLLLRLRQFCCHPALITTMFDKEDMASDGIEDADGLDLDLMDKMTRMSLAPTTAREESTDSEELGAVTLSAENPLFAKDRISSKMKEVLKILQDILSSDDDKAVVVSQWVSLLNVIHAVLKEKNIRCLVLNGSVAVKDRADIVTNFNRKGRGPRVILLSLTAGGVGLNLVGGNHLLLLDLHWNPQLESQACDRIYRVGQEKNVQIHKFVVAETIEERILKLQQSKLNMANDILTGSRHTSKLSLEDLKMLFQIKN